MKSFFIAAATAIGLMPALDAINQPATAQQHVVKPEHYTRKMDRPLKTWDYDGNQILGHVGEKICLWDATTGKLLQKLESHKERIFMLRLSPDGVHAFSSSWAQPGELLYESKDTRTIIWNLSSGDKTTEFADQVAGEFSPNGKRIVTFSKRSKELASFDATVWDVFTGKPIAKAKLEKYNSPNQDALFFSPDGLRFVHILGGDSGCVPSLHNALQVKLFDAAEGHEVGKTVSINGWGSRYTINGELATLGKGKATATDIGSGRVVNSVDHNLDRMLETLWTHDGKKVAVFQGERPIKILDVNSGKGIIGAKCGRQVTSAIVSPDSSQLAVVSEGANAVEGELLLCDMNSGTEIARIKLSKWADVIGFAPDSKTLLVGGSEFVIYNTQDGKKVRSLKLLDDVSFSHNWNR